MDFTVKKDKNLNVLAREIGYQMAYFQKEGEFSVIRKVHGDDYPRFHLYITDGGKEYQCSLHLDQKKVSYEGSHAHSGEYDGEVVEGEAQRIQEILSLE